jgi:hypothetical protein
MSKNENEATLQRLTISPPEIKFTFTMGDGDNEAKREIKFENGAFQGGSPSALLPGGSSKKSTRRNRSNRKRKQATKSRRAKRNRSLRNK